MPEVKRQRRNGFAARIRNDVLDETVGVRGREAEPLSRRRRDPVAASECEADAADRTGGSMPLVDLGGQGRIVLTECPPGIP
ncbi:hypothetical protein ACIRP2_21000 [Streptomyces sp. NPDC101194]|uniref:hypothetical protein n=1 Tax=Streptomyces sp. NPDC101194 TaxID=3366127 RepID=UPI0038005AAA